MTSSIVPADIDGTYPIAGQDNDSQGFRDNFTNIKNNFERAADELTDLQAKVVLKSALTGTSSVNNNMGGVVISSAKLQDTRLTHVDLGTVSGTVNVNYGLGHYQSATLGASTTIDFGSTFPGSTLNSAGFIILRIKITDTAYTLTFASPVGNGDAAKSLSSLQGVSGQTITFTETGTYEFEFYTTDGGDTVFVNELTRPRGVFQDTATFAGGVDVTANTAATSTSTGSIVTAGGAGIAGSVAVGGLYLDKNTKGNVTGNVSLSLSTSVDVFTTSANTAVTLGTGVEGQYKTLIANDVSSGNVTCTLDTVGEAGWGGSGEILFSNNGEACTLIYTSTKWFAVGNNGATFS